MGSAVTTTTPVEAVDALMKQVADEAGLEVDAQLASVPTASVEAEAASASASATDPLSRRLAALRE